MSTCAVYKSCTAMFKTHLALPLRLHVDNLANLSVSCIHDCKLWLVAECIEWLLLLEVVLNCFLLWMTYDSLNQIMNVKILRTFYRFIRNAGDAEINVLNVRLKIELIRIITIFWDDNLLALCAIFPLHQVSLIHRDFGRVVFPFSRVSPGYRKNWVLLATYQQSLGQRVSPNDLQWSY